MHHGSRHITEADLEFFLQAPFLSRVDLGIFHNGNESERYPMERTKSGEFTIRLSGLEGDVDYMFLLDGRQWRPDPASCFQPHGVHGPSRTVDFHKFEKAPLWPGLEMKDEVFYELHTGTFTREGTFSAAMDDLDRLKDLGITAIEVMPVSAFPGKRNWGYDGVYPFAVQESYGGPQGFHEFVSRCHEKDMGVILDVVYNHMGPEGNYLRDFGPYFTDSYVTPWGDGMNFDGPGSEIVRSFFMQNVEHWFVNFGVDALRIDAIHGIKDDSSVHILKELQQKTDEIASRLNKQLHLISESDLNDSCVIRPKEDGGYGHTAQWSDDFHHSVHALLTGESVGYYQDFGRKEQLVRAMNEGYVYQGEYSILRSRPHGNSTSGLDLNRFVFFIQNHDQVGNRYYGERLSVLLDEHRLRLATGLLLLSPAIPLLFMGEEYGETNPFLYFIDHGDPQLVRAVQEGRKREFASFVRDGESPDPASVDSYLSSKLNRNSLKEPQNKVIYYLHRQLLHLRKTEPSLQSSSRNHNTAWLDEKTDMIVLDRGEAKAMRILYYFEDEKLTIPSSLIEGHELLLDSREFPGTPSKESILPGAGFRLYRRGELS